MAKQVDFYLISNQVTDAKLKFASRLCNKIQRLDKKILVITDSVAVTERLDQILWEFSDTSFVAHEQITDQALSTIQIGEHIQVDQQVLARGYSVLINLCQSVPIFNHHFDRVAEIVDPSETDKAAARARFKCYQEEGFELKTHNIEL